MAMLDASACLKALDDAGVKYSVVEHANTPTIPVRVHAVELSGDHH